MAESQSFATAVYSDPNCTGSERWSSWRNALRSGSLALHSPLAENAAAALELSADAATCFLGAGALLLAQVAGAWRRGRFFEAVQIFAALHDQFLAGTHPTFYEQSTWPVRDADVRHWKSTLLYQVYHFREKGGERLPWGPSAFSESSIADPVERENLGSLASHVMQQTAQQEKRRTDQAAGTDELLPEWELPSTSALVPVPVGKKLPFRVYVYTEADVPGIGTLARSPGFCHYSQWGMDVGLHDFFQVSPLRTMDPAEADFFFVPAYSCCHQVNGLMDFPDLERAFISVIDRLPFFQRSGGRDHIFTFHYVDLFPSWRSYIPRGIFLTPETEVGFERSLEDFAIDQSIFPPFNPAKDVAVPPYLNMGDILGFHRHSRPMPERSALAVFAGKLWTDVAEAADVRNRVHALGGFPGVVIHAYATISLRLGPGAMQRLMGDARFCLVPRGRAAWSVRFFEALWAGCVPVLLSDHFEPPFGALFDLKEFVIKWPTSRIDASLVEFLASVPLAVVQRYSLAAKRVRCWYLYPPPDVSWLGNWHSRRELEQVEEELCPCLSSSRNAFQAVAEILGRRVQKTQAGSGRFFIPDPGRGYASSVVNAQLLPVDPPLR